MAEHTKSELVADAEALGIAGAADMTKVQLEEAILAHTPPALGPVIPEGQTQPAPEKPHGAVVTGVQPLEASDIPDAGR